MFELIERVAQGGFNWTRAEAERLHATLVAMLIGAFLLILVMWGVNATGWKEVNFIFFFLGGGFILQAGIWPRNVAIAAGAGIATGNGMMAGLRTLYRITLGVLFGFWVLSGILATWSFEKAPAAFFPIAAMVMTLGAMNAFYGISGRVAVKVITTYAVAVIAIAGWQTIPEEYRPFQGHGASSQQAPGTKTRQETAKWAAGGGGSLPVGTWSESFAINVGCKVQFDGGNGTDFRVRYRFYSAEWKEQIPGTYPNGSEVQFMLLKPRTAVPIKVTCR